jgi:RHS repeat-associated protein
MDGATGLTYMQQRYYDPMIGSFLSVDPVSVNTTTAWNFCRYCYAANNPYKFKDPDGRIVDTIADVGFIIYDIYALATDPSWTNAGALGADIVGAVVPLATGLGTAVRATSHGADAVKAASKAGDGVSQRAATREAKRQAGIPTSQQATSQTNGRAKDGTNVGRQQTFDVPKPGGGTESKSVQVSRDTRGAHKDMTQIEAGTVKPTGQLDQAGRPRLENEGKVRVDFDPDFDPRKL